MFGDTGGDALEALWTTRGVTAASPGPVPVFEHERLAAAWELLARSPTRALPVLRGRRCVGLLDDKCLVRARRLGSSADLHLSVGDVAHRGVASIRSDDSLAEVLVAITSSGLDAAAVVDEEGHYLGLVTLAEAVRPLAELLSARRARGGRATRGRSLPEDPD